MKNYLTVFFGAFIVIGCGGGGSGSGNETPPSYSNVVVELSASEKNASVARHNYYRKVANNSHLPYDLVDLIWDEDLAKAAQVWAEYLAQHFTEGDYNNSVSPHAKEFQTDQHSYDTHSAGENIANLTADDNAPPYSPVGTAIDVTQEYTLKELIDMGAGAIDGWASEAYLYHEKYGEPKIGLEPNFSKYGHYTQMIWKDTKKVGCGRARSVNKIATVTVSWSDGSTTQEKRKVDWIVCRYLPAGNINGEKPY